MNVLTVVASESYKDFVTALQKDISESLTTRPRFATEKYFTGKLLKLDTGDVAVTQVRYEVVTDYGKLMELVK